MSEQTANLCTTDACESLRARLAKYEDAEGRPLQSDVVDERAAFEVEIPSIAATFDGLYLTPVMPLKAGDHLMTIAQHLLIEKQVRAALTASAPSHGEQVREGWQLVPKTIPCEMHSAFWNAIPHGPTSGIRVQEAWAAMLAEAPSAGSQKEQE